MCSGCSGNYEDFDGPEQDAPAEMKFQEYEDSSPGQRIPVEDRFEVLVSAETIREIRVISSNGLAAQELIRHRGWLGAARMPSGAEQSRSESAKNYRTQAMRSIRTRNGHRETDKSRGFRALAGFPLRRLARRLFGGAVLRRWRTRPGDEASIDAR